MRDDLIGFVLGALDADEHEQIRRKVEQDGQLQQQVQQVQQCLQPLAGLRCDYDPPAGLAARTCDHLLALSGDLRRAGDVQGASPLRADLSAAPGTRSNPVERGSSGLWGSEVPAGFGVGRAWTLADFVVAAGVCLAASCLFFPALINSRYHSQLAGCQRNLQGLGQSLISYSDLTDGYFPAIPPSGNLSFAGVFAPKLAAKGLAPDRRVFLCPAKESTVVLRIPPLSEIAGAQGPQLVAFHRTMGGDYAYPLGFVHRGHLYGIRNQSRKNVPLLADAPIENLRNVSIGSHGRGQNVLFEDGRVAFLAQRQRPGAPQDDIFFNALGLAKAGVDRDDLVLGASYVSPLPVDEDDIFSLSGPAR